MRVGIVGFGFMGRMHFAHWLRCEGVDVVAICDGRDPEQVRQCATGGNIEGAAPGAALGDRPIYRDAAEMIANESLDAVSITLPSHLHASFSLQALRAGVHVLCEKPMALTSAEGREMLAEARRCGRHLMVGHCLRFWPEYVAARELVRGGRYGAVRVAAFQRYSAAPAWSQDGWLQDAARSGGMPLDLHIHDTDFVRHLFGLPVAVSSEAVARQGQWLHIHTRYDTGDDRLVCAEAGWLATASFGFQMSFTLFLESATLVFDSTRSPTFRVCPEGGESFVPELAAGDGYAGEIAHFAALIQGRADPALAAPEESLDAVRIVEAELRSVRAGGRRMEIEAEPTDGEL